MKQTNPDVPPLAELFRRSNAFLVNTVDFIDFARPVPPQLHYIGGLAVDHEVEPLAKVRILICAL